VQPPKDESSASCDSTVEGEQAGGTQNTHREAGVRTLAACLAIKCSASIVWHEIVPCNQLFHVCRRQHA